MTTTELNNYEKTILLCNGSTAAALGNACLVSVTVPVAGEPAGSSYEVTTESTTPGHTFTIKRLSTGVTERKCTPTGETGSKPGGCQNSSW